MLRLRPKSVFICLIGLYILFIFIGSRKSSKKIILDINTGIPEQELIIQKRLEILQLQYTDVSIYNKTTLREKLAFQFPYDQNKQFPKIIWQTWKVSPSSKEFPERLRKWQIRWNEQNPNYRHILLDDEQAKEFVEKEYKNIKEIIDTYNALPTQLLKADLLRYLIGYAKGGVYTDIDTAPLEAIDNWKSTKQDDKDRSIGFVIGVEVDPDREDWYKYYARQLQFCQWTFQVKPGHPLLREVIARVIELTQQNLKKEMNYRDIKTILNWTGSGVWTDSIFDYLNDYDIIHPLGLPKLNTLSKESVKKLDVRIIVDKFKQISQEIGKINVKSFSGLINPKVINDVMILPITSFSPGIGRMGSKGIDDELAYVVHFFMGTWKEDSSRNWF